MVNIVTDSTSDIPLDIARELHITVIPVHVIFGKESFADGVTITREEFYRRLKTTKVLTTTSTPSAGEFAETYQRVGGEIVSIHVASNWSSLLSVAQVGASLAQLGDCPCRCGKRASRLAVHSPGGSGPACPGEQLQRDFLDLQ